MLCLRSTSLGHDLPSPAELLNGWVYQTNLPPVSKASFSADDQCHLNFNLVKISRRSNMIKQPSSHKVLRSLSLKDCIRVFNAASGTWTPEIVQHVADTSHSYLVATTAHSVVIVCCLIYRWQPLVTMDRKQTTLLTQRQKIGATGQQPKAFKSYKKFANDVTSSRACTRYFKSKARCAKNAGHRSCWNWNTKTARYCSCMHCLHMLFQTFSQTMISSFPISFTTTSFLFRTAS